MAKAAATSETATSRPATAAPPKLSIAVLPFANMSGDAEQDYFADGNSEDIKEEAGSDARAHR
jgi:adenylate cyclase